jgi:hypothetical protein
MVAYPADEWRPARRRPSKYPRMTERERRAIAAALAALYPQTQAGDIEEMLAAHKALNAVTDLVNALYGPGAAFDLRPRS